MRLRNRLWWRHWRYAIATVLTLGTVLSVSFLAFSGLYLIYPVIVVAVLAFILSGFIEGKIFAKSIFKGLGRLKLVGFGGSKRLLSVELEYYLDSHLEKLQKNGESIIDSPACNFLKDYYQARKYYKSTKSKEAKSRLEELREFFFRQSVRGISNNYLDSHLIEVAVPMLRTARQGAWLLRFFLVISLLLGVGTGFVTASAMSSAIALLAVKIGLVLTTSALLATVWPIAITAAIGGVFLFYYTVTDIVKHSVIEKALKNLKQLFKRKTLEGVKEQLPTYIFRLTALTVLATVITGLTVFATIATAGTWWFAVKAGTDLLPRLPIVWAAMIRGILIPLNWITDIIYGFSTTLQTIDKCKGLLTPVRYIQQLYGQAKKGLRDLKTKETWWQFFNPFRIITKLIISPFQWLIFWGHVISMGLTTDRLGNLPPIVVAAGCTIPEALQDASFFVKDEAKENNNTNCGKTSGEHDHDHGDFLTVGLKVILSPLIFLSALWHWGFQKKEIDLTFYDALKQNFDRPKHDNEEKTAEQAPQLSKDWREKYRPKFLLLNAEERLYSAIIDRKNAKEKKEVMESLNISEVVYYVKQGVTEGKSTGEAVAEYLEKKPKKEKPLTNGCISNLPNASLANGYLSKSTIKSVVSNKKDIPSAMDTLNRCRTWCRFFECEVSKPTTTSQLVKEAFRLVAAA